MKRKRSRSRSPPSPGSETSPARDDDDETFAATTVADDVLVSDEVELAITRLPRPICQMVTAYVSGSITRTYCPDRRWLEAAVAWAQRPMDKDGTLPTLAEVDRRLAPPPPPAPVSWRSSSLEETEWWQFRYPRYFGEDWTHRGLVSRAEAAILAAQCHRGSTVFPIVRGEPRGVTMYLLEIQRFRDPVDVQRQIKEHGRVYLDTTPYLPNYWHKAADRHTSLVSH